MRWFVVFALLALAPDRAWAQEETARLKQAPGVELVEAQCGACHSLRYILMNEPFLGPAQWDAEVAKMIKAFGAPIEPADAATIGSYLKNNYGG
ncbi:MAG TPA: cytochrome c [Methylocella sp.]|nr:cytochrome c [Methylocella sp.]